MFETKLFVCSSCGYQGQRKNIIKGSFLIELGLWILFIIPGLIYSLWRLTSKYKGCPECQNNLMIPIDSPRGQQLIKEVQY